VEGHGFSHATKAASSTQAPQGPRIWAAQRFQRCDKEPRIRFEARLIVEGHGFSHATKLPVRLRPRRDQRLTTRGLWPRFDRGAAILNFAHIVLQKIPQTLKFAQNTENERPEIGNNRFDSFVPNSPVHSRIGKRSLRPAAFFLTPIFHV
jgi:hypothetical protein